MMTVTLSADADLGATTLRIRYQIANSTDGTIYLLNVVERWTSAGLLTDPSIIYTEVIDGALRLTKGSLSIPDYLDVESPDVPLLTPVEAGAVFTEDMTLGVPLAPYHPYDEIEWSAEVVTYDDVALAIGWLPSQVDVRSAMRPDGTLVTSARYQDIMREQQLLVVPLSVAVPTHLRPRSGHRPASSACAR